MCNFDNMEDVDAADLCAGGPAADSRRINEKYRFTVYAYRRK